MRRWLLVASNVARKSPHDMTPRFQLIVAMSPGDKKKIAPPRRSRSPVSFFKVATTGKQLTTSPGCWISSSPPSPIQDPGGRLFSGTNRDASCRWIFLCWAFCCGPGRRSESELASGDERSSRRSELGHARHLDTERTVDGLPLPSLSVFPTYPPLCPWHIARAALPLAGGAHAFTVRAVVMTSLRAE